jgi:hypothetical protein
MGEPSKKRGALLTILGGIILAIVDNIGRIQTVADVSNKLKDWFPAIARIVLWGHFFDTWMGVSIAAFGCLLYFWPTREQKPEDTTTPLLTATTFSADLIPHIRKNAFLVHVRNDAASPLAVAKDVVAHIGYRRQDGRGMQVDYGAWMENAPTIDIPRGQTKRLIVALTDQGKNYAVNFTGPRTNFMNPELVTIGELTPGSWMMVVVVNAEHYKGTFHFHLTVEENGAVGCRQIVRPFW